MPNREFIIIESYTGNFSLWSSKSLITHFRCFMGCRYGEIGSNLLYNRVVDYFSPLQNINPTEFAFQQMREDQENGVV